MDSQPVTLEDATIEELIDALKARSQAFVLTLAEPDTTEGTGREMIRGHGSVLYRESLVKWARRWVKDCVRGSVIKDI